MPRIIYFDIDCLRPDHLGCYGYDRPTSPAIDSIAAEGTRFNHYYCASSPCLPARTALMSGRFGINNGVISNHGAGARFQIDKHLYTGPKDHHQPFPRQLMKHEYDPICFSNFADRHFAMWYMCGWREFHTVNLKGGSETADEVNARVLPWLKKNAQRENYYLHINYWDTHRCYRMDEKWADRFKDYPVTQDWPDETAIREQQNVEGSFTNHGQFKDDESPFPLMPGAINNRADFEKMVTGYDASIAYVDAHVREVLDELEAQSILDDAVVIISADHGDAFGEHAVYSDHVCIDECIQRIPLIIRWPGKTSKDTASDAFMYNVDYAPTICDLLGLPIPEGWNGKSYAGNVKGEAGEDRERLVWDSGLYTVQRAVRSHEHLYIRTYDHYNYNNRADDELYDMQADPFQTCNIAAGNPDQVKDYRQYMDDWVAEQKEKNGNLPDPVDLILEERKPS
ncbi:sulfatase [Planctomycetota bacterium]